MTRNRRRWIGHLGASLIVGMGLLSASAAPTPPAAPASAARRMTLPGEDPALCRQVQQALQDIQTIHAGSTDADLMQKFELVGGLSDGNTFSYRRCENIKIHVTFRNNSPFPHHPTDVVTNVSRPYLDLVYSD